MAGVSEALAESAQTLRQHVSDLLSMKPITGIAGCCARAASGQAIVALPRRGDELASSHAGPKAQNGSN
jgi:hypothetical protein